MPKEQSETKVVGVYRIDKWRLDSLRGSMALREIVTSLGTLPINTFEPDTYPDAEEEIYGDLIPIAFGVVKGAAAFPIDPDNNKFKVVDHSIMSFDEFRKDNGTVFTPTTVDLSTSEFTWDDWDGSETLFADITAEGENPVDCVKLMLTDSVKGAGLPLSDLDTTSTGNKGFGSGGARLEYVRATNSLTGAEIMDFSIGLYVNSDKPIIRHIEKVLAAAFGILYVGLSGLYQIKAWKVATSEGLGSITDANIRGRIKTSIVASDTITKVISSYGQRHDSGDFQTVEFKDERLRQLRGLAQHRVLKQELSLSTRFAAKYWAERSVGMRSVPRRILKMNVTQEFMLNEPGDYIRVTSEADGIDEVFEVIAITINPGSLSVSLKLIDNRGHNLQPGFWVGDAVSFPARLGGGAITQWDNTWTAEQKVWAAENIGFWGSDNDYIDQTDDTADSYRKSVWT